MKSLALECLIRASQHTKYGNSKISFNVLQDGLVREGPRKRTESDHEATGLDEFVSRFNFDLLASLSGQIVLDFGCGYGGKAVELASRLPSSTVIGVDQHQKKVDSGYDYAERRRISNVSFKLCSQEKIPLEDDSIDAVVCHDVLEHVHRPDLTFAELHRVLKPGGKTYIVFPPYDGPASHHLDFITSVPGLHWFFTPDTLMVTINRILATEYGARFKTPPQPGPSHSPIDGRRVLPSLNGMGTESLLNLTGGLFTIQSLERLTLIDRLAKIRLPRFARESLKRVAVSRLLKK